VGGLSPPSRSRSRQHWGSKGCGRTKSALPIPMKSSSSLDPMSRGGRANEALLRKSKGVGGLSPPCRSRRCFTHTIPSIKLPPCGLQNDIYRLPLCGHENSYLYIYIYIYIYIVSASSARLRQNCSPVRRAPGFLSLCPRLVWSGSRVGFGAGRRSLDQSGQAPVGNVAVSTSLVRLRQTARQVGGLRVSSPCVLD
jgi:hypothetical protein